MKAWWQLGDELLVKFNHFGYYNTDRRTMERRPMEFPDIWKKAVRTLMPFWNKPEIADLE